MDSKLNRNLPVLYAFSFFWLAMVIMPVLVPFFETRGLDLAEVFYLQSLFAAVVVLLEVPSGYVADVFGRKKALVAGAVFHGIGFTWLIWAEGFWELVLFEAILGVGLSLMSGADLSLLYDSQAAMNASHRDKARGIANLRVAKSLSEGTSALIGGLLILHSFELTVLANAVFAWIPLGLALLLVEAPFERMQRHTPVSNLKEVIRHLLMEDRLLRLTCINITFFSLATCYVVWLLQPYWIGAGASLGWLGVLWAAQSFLFALTCRVSLALEERFGARLVLVVMGLLPVLGYWGMAATGGVLGILMSFLFFVSRGLNQVILTDALNRRVPAKFRATANSMTSFAFRLVFIVTGPLLGMLVSEAGMTVALLVLGGVVVVMNLVFMWPLVAAIGEGADGQAAVSTSG